VTQPRAAAEQENGRRRPGGRPWPKGVSGNPSGSQQSKRALALFDEMAADFGGVDALTAIDKTMLAQASRLLVRSERAKNADIAVRLSNASARLLAGLRKTKHQRGPASGPTLGDLLRQDRAEQLAAAAGADDDGAAP
jgi:hypothetical protein